MPKNSAFAPVMGALAFVFGFAMIWYLWWLAIVCAVAAVITIIVRASSDDTDDLLPASKVEAIETQRLEELARAPRPDHGDEPGAVPGAAIPGTAS